MLIHQSAPLFDLSNLRENIVLDTTQEAYVRFNISSTEDLIAGLDARIRDTENALVALRKRRNDALESIAVPVALVAPVRKLPSEILGEIFQQCVPIEPNYVTPFDSRDAPLLLTRVCHRWRQVAQGMSLLWTNLVFYGRTPEALFSSIWLKNSGSVPIDISVDIYPGDMDSQSSPQPKQVNYPIHAEHAEHGWRMDHHMVWLWPKCSTDQTTQTVLEQLSRIRRLWLVCQANELRGYFPKEAVATVPSLQELNITLTSMWNVDPTAFSFHNFFTPRLHTLVLVHCAELLLPALECSNLRSIYIRGNCTVQTFVEFVRMSPSLELVTAVDMDVNYLREPMDMRPVILPNVWDLDVGISYESFMRFSGGFQTTTEGWIYLTKPLERLRTPNLEYLMLRYLPLCGHILPKFLANSHSNFHSLAIQNMTLDALYLCDAMSIFSAIEDLEILRCVVSQGFWESLTHAEDTPSNLWTFPKLKQLVIEHVSMALEDEAEFVRFVESRAPPIRSQGQSPFEGICYLKEVKLIHSSFSEETLIALECLTRGREDFVISSQGSQCSECPPE